VEEKRNIRMHIPVTNAFVKKDVIISKAEARRRLGIKDDQVFLLSMASSYKFHPFLLDLVSPVLAAFPNNLTYVAFGPDDWNQYPKKPFDTR
jgi:predicted O-linked N-acetylglucosamine transferase (SPINDLY family)